MTANESGPPAPARPADAPTFVAPFRALIHNVHQFGDHWWSWRCGVWYSRLDPGYLDGACRYDHIHDSYEQLVTDATEHLARWHGIHLASACGHEAQPWEADKIRAAVRVGLVAGMSDELVTLDELIDRVENAFDSCAIEVDVWETGLDGQRTVQSSHPLYRLTRCLRSHGVLDESRGHEAQPGEAEPPAPVRPAEPRVWRYRNTLIVEHRYGGCFDVIELTATGADVIEEASRVPDKAVELAPACGHEAQPGEAERGVSWYAINDWMIRLSFAIEKWETRGYTEVVTTVKKLRDDLERIADRYPAPAAAPTAWLLIKYGWDNQTVLAVYDTEAEARRVLAGIQAVAKRHRDYEDTCHPLEQNLGVEQVRFGHVVTFEEAVEG